MATSSVASVVNMAFLILGLASFLSIVSAEKATTNALDILPDYLENSAMALALATDAGPINVEYKVAPLTSEAGLNQTNENTLQAFNVQGNLVIVDQNNYNKPDIIKDAITYVTCDDPTDDTYITPNDVINEVMGGQPKAILLFSTVATFCSVGGTDLAFKSIWTMTDPQEAGMVKNMTSDTSMGIVRATIMGNDTDAESTTTQSQGGNNSAVAMSILYSITGLITLLFLIIIATGAVRAHRHPERYGPRAGYGGRPRQSRAKGLARAVLETLPIVKFGDPKPAKPDPENELESISGDRQQHSSSPAPRELASNDVEHAGASPDAVAKADPITTAEISVTTASGESKGNDGQVEEEQLDCSICTEDFSVGEDVRVLPCNHKFHPQCIDPWLVNVSGTCPLCRLDLRPHGEDEEEEEEGDASMPTIQPTAQSGAAGEGHVDSHLAPPAPSPAEEVAVTSGRRMSRLLDWNRLRHASVDERILALRQYRESQGVTSSEDQNRHSKLSDRLKEKFHIRTNAHSSEDTASTSR